MTQVFQDGFLHTAEKKQAFADLFGGDYANRFSDPVTFRDVTFYSPPVSQEYRQNFKVLSRNLFAEWVYRRRRGFSVEILDHYVHVSGAKLDAIKRLISGDRDRLRSVAEANGIEIDAGYLHCRNYLVPVIHNHALDFLKILMLFDELLQMTGSCALNGLLSAEERKRIEVRSRAAIRSFSNTIRTESIKMRKEAQRVLSEQGEDTELQETVKAQSEAEKHAEAQQEIDRMGADVPDGQDPVEALANLRAAAAAATRQSSAAAQAAEGE